MQETYLDALVSYTIDVSLKGKLSFGLKLGGKFLNLDFAQLQQRYDPDEQEFLNGDNIDNKFSPNFGLGLYYHTDKFYAGLSAPNLLETEHFNDSSTDSERNNFLSKERINFYLITGYVFDLNDNLKFKPALLTKVVGGAPLQLDLSTSFLFVEKFSLGAAYRWDAAVSGLAGFQVTDQIMLGLAYDSETTSLGNRRFNNGSFEVFLRWELVKSFEKLVSPRFF